MRTTRRQTLGALGGLGALAGWPGLLQAQTIEQPRILYGFPPGSAGDLVARRIAERLGGTTYARQPAMVDNRSGAGGRIALETLKTAPADGSVMALTPFSTAAIYPHVYRRLPYDPQADFAAVSIAAVAHHGLAVGPRVPAQVRDVKGFVAWAHTHPDDAAYGSPAAGSPPHFLGALLAFGQRLELRHVPYRGSVPGITDLLGGQIAAMFTPAGDFLAHHRSGRLRLLATSGRTRLPFSPEVPTFAEQGFGELLIEEWFGFYMPARVPGATIAAANSAIVAALKERAVIDALASVGLIARGSTPEEMARSQREEFERWGPLVRRIGFSAES